MFYSNALWPNDDRLPPLKNSDNTTMDRHDTKKEAESVCKMLQYDGFGGEGEIFPVKTWVDQS